MDVDRWQRLSPLLDVLLELPADAREAQLQILRDEDPTLATDVEKLLALEEQTTDFIAAPLLVPDRGDGQLRAGTMMGPYRLENPLGEGGMGTVWLASRADGLYQRRVALKLLRPGLADPGLRQRFDREREILARLEHRHIARLLDAGIGAGDQPYLALEHVLGIPITDYCHGNELPLEARLKLFLQVCDAVSYAHANLVVHRDLKPSNILVTTTGEVRLLDFGIAKLLEPVDSSRTQGHTELRAFTLHYAAPEQIRGGAVTTMTDVYTLGVVLYELLTGAKPYRLRRLSDAEWEQAILAVEPLKPSVAVRRSGDTPTQPEARRLAWRLRGDLDNIVLKALAKLPESRYASAEALASDLRRHLEGRPIRARAPSLGYRMGKYIRRQRWPLAIGGSVAALLLAALAISLHQTEQARREAQRAQAMQDFVIDLFDGAGSARQGALFDAHRMLDAGERRGEGELASQPLARIELLDTIARLRISIGDYPQALELLQRQQVLLDQQADAPVAMRVAAAIQHGRALALLDRGSDCVQRMLPLQAATVRLRGQSLQQAAFDSQLGRCQRVVGRSQEARLLFEQALALRREAGDGVGVAESTWDLAQLDAAAGRIDHAHRGFDRALAELQRHTREPHPLTMDILRSRATLMRSNGDGDAALADYERALRIADGVYGQDHPSTVALRRQIVALKVDQERYREAEDEARTLHELTIKALGPQHRETGRSWNTLGIIAWQLGRNQEAMDDLARAVAIWRGSGGELQLLADGLFNYGMILHAAGSDDEALRALQESRRLRVQQFGASDGRVGNTDRVIGEVLAAQGKTDEAGTYLDRALKLTRIGAGPQNLFALQAQLSLAQHYARSGRFAEAHTLLEPLADLQVQGSELPKLRWQGRAWLADIDCRGVHAAKARRDLDALLVELRRERPDGGVVTREAEAIRAACGATTATATATVR
ncbi:MAG: tetratricopeptide repeat protein [Pseudoxanthomonas sp.]